MLQDHRRMNDVDRVAKLWTQCTAQAIALQVEQRYCPGTLTPVSATGYSLFSMTALPFASRGGSERSRTQANLKSCECH